MNISHFTPHGMWYIRWYHCQFSRLLTTSNAIKSLVPYGELSTSSFTNLACSQSDCGSVSFILSQCFPCSSKTHLCSSLFYCSQIASLSGQFWGLWKALDQVHDFKYKVKSLTKSDSCATTFNVWDFAAVDIIWRAIQVSYSGSTRAKESSFLMGLCWVFLVAAVAPTLVGKEI